MPEGDSEPCSGHSAVTALVFASRRTTVFLLSMLTNTVPLPSTLGNSGLPDSLIVATTFWVAVSITDASLLRPLKAQQVFVTGSYVMPSGSVPAPMAAHVIQGRSTL